MQSGRAQSRRIAENAPVHLLGLEVQGHERDLLKIIRPIDIELLELEAEATRQLDGELSDDEGVSCKDDEVVFRSVKTVDTVSVVRPMMVSEHCLPAILAMP